VKEYEINWVGGFNSLLACMIIGQDTTFKLTSTKQFLIAPYVKKIITSSLLNSQSVNQIGHPL
jgi:hypothetical protein